MARPTSTRAAGKARIGHPGLHSKRTAPKPTLRTAHDVRRLVCCAGCTALSDGRALAKVGAEHWHGRCYVAMNGLDALLALPQSETDKLTIGDIGDKVMRAVLKQRTA